MILLELVVNLSCDPTLGQRKPSQFTKKPTPSRIAASLPVNSQARIFLHNSPLTRIPCRLTLLIAGAARERSGTLVAGEDGSPPVSL